MKVKAPTVGKRRPAFTQTIERLIEHLAESLPAFAHVNPRQVLVVAGEARRASRGTIRPLRFARGKRKDAQGRRKPKVRMGAVEILYCITLRPLFFRQSTPRQRVATIAHELFHTAPAFDGTLNPNLRHDVAGAKFEAEFRAVERLAWKTLPMQLRRALGYNGEVRMRQWLEKPLTSARGQAGSSRQVYTEAHTFEGIMRLKSPDVTE